MTQVQSLILLACATVLLLLAHITRATRWGLLFPAAYVTRRYNLLLGLGLGYAVNFFIPLRAGELIRAVFVSRRGRIRLSHVAATVFVERVVDLLCVSLIMAAIFLRAQSRAHFGWSTPLAMIAAASLAFILIILIHRSERARRLVWMLASIFNERLRREAVDFFWSSAEIFSSSTLVRWRFVCSTVVMWVLYIASYGLFGASVGINFLEVIDIFIGRPLNAIVGLATHGDRLPVVLALFFFAVIPLGLIIAYGFFSDHQHLRVAWDSLRRRGKSGTGTPLSVRKRFQEVHTYNFFLESLFSGTNRLVSGFGLEAIDGCVIHKFFNGGSDAITALVEVDGQLLIRKFAIGAAAAKLKVQADWLRERRNSGTLPLVAVLGEHTSAETYVYDMPLVTPSNDFYDVIHTSPVDHSHALLRSILQKLVEFHSSDPTGPASKAVVRSYLQFKAIDNARMILDFARTNLPDDELVLNGRPFALSQWDRLLDMNWLEAQVTSLGAGRIHGDLTIENIIITPALEPGFYIIDPNSENIFNSPLIDWAKLMQSLHLGYETLNRGLTCNVMGGTINIPDLRSQIYAELHKLLESEAIYHLGNAAIREIYFHELVNYLRLTTYKIRQSQKKGIGFFACTSILLERYLERYG